MDSRIDRLSEAYDRALSDQSHSQELVKINSVIADIKGHLQPPISPLFPNEKSRLELLEEAVKPIGNISDDLALAEYRQAWVYQVQADRIIRECREAGKSYMRLIEGSQPTSEDELLECRQRWTRPHQDLVRLVRAFDEKLAAFLSFGPNSDAMTLEALAKSGRHLPSALADNPPRMPAIAHLDEMEMYPIRLFWLGWSAFEQVAPYITLVFLEDRRFDPDTKKFTNPA